MRLEPRDGPDSLVPEIRLRTGPDGAACAEAVLTGRFIVWSDRGIGVDCHVEAGERAEVALVLPPGADISGLVVDPEGAGVPGAEVWLAEAVGSWCASPVARTDETGQFHLRPIGLRSAIGARASGYAPTRMEFLGISRKPIRDLRLGLRGEGGALSGNVVGPDAKPVVAAVWVRDDTDQGGIPPIRLRTDSEGHFRCEGVLPGSVRVEARAARLAPCSSLVRVDAGFLALAGIRLGPGATVAGTVRDEAGQAVAGAVVSSAERSDISYSRVRTSADGSFRLEGLASGTVRILASAERLGKAETTLPLEGGRTTPWSPVLDGGLRILGRLEDSRGVPLAGWSVVADNPSRVVSCTGERFTVYGTTDDQGRFALVNCPDWELHLSRPFRLDPRETLDLGTIRLKAGGR